MKFEGSYCNAHNSQWARMGGHAIIDMLVLSKYVLKVFLRLLWP